MTPAEREPVRPASDGSPELPARSAAAQRRSMQAALASAVRDMRSSGGRRTTSMGPSETPPLGRT